MENHNFSWENQLFVWVFSVNVDQRVPSIFSGRFSDVTEQNSDVTRPTNVLCYWHQKRQNLAMFLCKLVLSEC